MLNRWHSLTAHPLGAANAIERVEVSVGQIRQSEAMKRDRLVLQFRVECPPGSLFMPARQPPLRGDGLWQTTCCELFIKGPGSSYREYNFSPSTQWAAYHFDNYRERSGWLECEQPPSVHADIEPYGLLLDADIPLDGQDKLRIGLSAVIEEVDRTKSYWALRHPPGPPDFHHPDCFALTLEAPGRP